MTPLADRMRPQNLSEVVGQEHIVGPDKLLFKAIKNKQLFSMIFWGPPGVGKTTLARIIANETGAEFMEFSAVNTSTVELKKIFQEIANRHSGSLEQSERLIESNKIDPIASARAGLIASLQDDKRVVIFIDEIHRFSKSQQDAFLPYVENGTITLIGATTENPSFEVIGPLLSRSRVFVLKPLSKDQLKLVVERALKDKEKGLGIHKIKLNDDALDLLLEASFGDGRVALNTLEIAAESHLSGERDKAGHLTGDCLITRDLIEESFQKKMLMYDKAGEEHYNTISAFIKSMRASNVDAALYYLARMVASGEDPLFIARRMVIFASEDIGMAVPTALVVANEVFRACETIGYPECQINLAHGATYLASAKKSRQSHDAYFKALGDAQKYGNLPIPLKIRNAPTKLMKDLGYGEGYQKYTTEDLLPEKLKGKKYY